jgi:hypothetical protein
MPLESSGKYFSSGLAGAGSGAGAAVSGPKKTSKARIGNATWLRRNGDMGDTPWSGKLVVWQYFDFMNAVTMNR